MHRDLKVLLREIITHWKLESNRKEYFIIYRTMQYATWRWDVYKEAIKK